MKKVMRGPFWNYLFMGSVVGIVGCVFMIATDENSRLGGIAGIAICALYIVAYFVVPTYIIKPKAPLPVAPAENTVLSVPATLTIIRDNSAVGALAPTIIFLNGVQVCSINNGASARITLTQRRNILKTNAIGSSKVRYEFDVTDGAKGEIHVKGNEFQIRTAKWDTTR